MKRRWRYISALTANDGLSPLRASAVRLARQQMKNYYFTACIHSFILSVSNTEYRFNSSFLSSLIHKKVGFLFEKSSLKMALKRLCDDCVKLSTKASLSLFVCLSICRTWDIFSPMLSPIFSLSIPSSHCHTWHGSKVQRKFSPACCFFPCNVYRLNECMLLLLSCLRKEGSGMMKKGSRDDTFSTRKNKGK